MIVEYLFEIKLVKDGNTMINKKRFLQVLMIFLIISATDASGNDSPRPANGSGQIALEIIPGRYFANRGWFFIFPFKKGPQIAAWIEDEKENYMGTIVISDKTAGDCWISAPEEGRPESLPVWSHRSSGICNSIDAVTAASRVISENSRINSSLKLPAGRYRVFLEVNNSYDWNKVWRKKLPESSPYFNGVNGQPSVIYHADLEIGHGPAAVKMVPAGTGNPLGRNGNIDKSFDGIDSALSILESVYVKINE